MRWIVGAEVILTVLLFAAARYSEGVARSADEAVIAAPFYLAGFGGVVAIIVTVLLAVMWR